MILVIFLVGLLIFGCLQEQPSLPNQSEETGPTLGGNIMVVFYENATENEIGAVDSWLVARGAEKRNYYPQTNTYTYDLMSNDSLDAITPYIENQSGVWFVSRNLQIQPA